MKTILLFFFGFCPFVTFYSQTPQLLWSYDVNDSSFGISSSGDIDVDGKLEIVFSCYRNDSSIYALNAEDGSLLWKVNTGGCNDVSPLIYDVDMDGLLDVVLPSSCVAETFCFNGIDGSEKWSTPLHGSDSPPTVGDLDNDGKPEILHGNFGGYVTCLNGEDGSIAWDIAVDLNSWIQTEPIILDADNDGQLDFIVGNWSFGTDYKIWCFRGSDHQQLWVSDLPSDYIYHGASFADIDNDGYQEIAIGDYSGNLMVLNAENGSLKWDYSFASPFYIGAPTSMGDLNNDGLYEIVFFDGDHLGVLTNTGSLLWDFYIPSYGSAFRGAALSDVNNDDTLDLVFGTSLGIVYALHGNSGDEIWNVDLAAQYGGTFEIDHAPVISDFDNDGTLDFFLVGGYSDYPDVSGNYGRGYAYSTGGSGGPDWLMFRRDSVRSARVPLDSSVVFSKFNIPQNFSAEAYPNPFIRMLTIEYKLLQNTELCVSIYDITGNKAGEIFKGFQTAGSYSYKIDFNEFGLNESGIYFLKIISNEAQITKKIFRMN